MIYIITHKEVKTPNLDSYVTMQVGAELNNSLGYLKDNTGDNISVKNPNYCELTGLYWIWKNTDDDYKGLVHYRRYFGKNNFSNKFEDIYSYETLKGFLKDSDIVLSYVENFKQNAKEAILVNCCTEEIFAELEKVVQEKYSDYMPAFNEYFSNNKSTLFNMMFCEKKYFDSYCEWLFDILFELENRIAIDTLNNYQKRIYGFLSERLLNVWVIKNNLVVKNLPIINTEFTFKQKLTILRRRITNEIFFKLSKLKAQK